MVHRGIATISLILLVSFLLLSHFDGNFFLFHFYESLLYVTILLMLFYFEDRWAYTLGILAPAVWMILIFAIGGMAEAGRQVSLLLQRKHPTDATGMMLAIIVLFSILMIIFCAIRWKRMYAGMGKGLSTFLIGGVITAVYYGIMIVWFWQYLSHPWMRG
jgi:hypothetical protein